MIFLCGKENALYLRFSVRSGHFHAKNVLVEGSCHTQDHGRINYTSFYNSPPPSTPIATEPIFSPTNIKEMLLKQYQQWKTQNKINFTK